VAEAVTDSGPGATWVRFPLDLPITLWRDDAPTTAVAREMALQRGEHGLTALTLTLARAAEGAVDAQGAGESPDDVVVTLWFRDALVGSLPTNAVALRRGLTRRGELTDADNWSMVSPT
jgi:hypothetical protein